MERAFAECGGSPVLNPCQVPLSHQVAGKDSSNSSKLCIAMWMFDDMLQCMKPSAWTLVPVSVAAHEELAPEAC